MGGKSRPETTEAGVSRIVPSLVGTVFTVARRSSELMFRSVRVGNSLLIDVSLYDIKFDDKK